MTWTCSSLPFFEKFDILGGSTLSVFDDSELEMTPWHDWGLLETDAGELDMVSRLNNELLKEKKKGKKKKEKELLSWD